MRKDPDELSSFNGFTAESLLAIHHLANGGKIGLNKGSNRLAIAMVEGMDQCDDPNVYLTAYDLLQLVRRGVLQLGVNPKLKTLWDGWQVKIALENEP